MTENRTIFVIELLLANSTRSWSLTLATKEFRTKNKNSNISGCLLQSQAEVSQLCCMDLGNKLQRQKECPWSLGEGKQWKGAGMGACERERERESARASIHKCESRVCMLGPLSQWILSVIQGRDFRGSFRRGSQWLSISFPGVSFQVHSLYWMVSARGPLVISAGPDVTHGIASSGSAAFLGLELKHNWGLGIISTLSQTLCLWSMGFASLFLAHLTLIRTSLSWGLTA